MRLQITDVDHTANAFWTLDPNVKHEAPAEVVFEALPEAACERDEGRAMHEHHCFVADLLDDDGWLVTDREISEEVAQALLDEPIPVLRDRFRTMLFEVYGALG
jgi:hypothetical protein